MEPPAGVILRLMRPARRSTCVYCQWRRFQVSAHPAAESKFRQRSPEFQYTRTGTADPEWVPKPLTRPLGLTKRPEPGQNSGRDERSLRQRWEDFANFETHKQKRLDLLDEVVHKNYMRELYNIGKIYRGKSMIAPKTPYRSDVALYYPNLQGVTLATPNTKTDTTHVFRDRITILNVFSFKWSEEQALSFTSKDSNPALHEYLAEVAAEDAAVASRPVKGPRPPVIQQAYINIEENIGKYYLVKMLFGKYRKMWPKEEHGRYFLVRRGMDDDIRDALGMWNSRIGYVYVLDADLKVRWAGNGNANDEEKDSLVNCLKRIRKASEPASNIGNMAPSKVFPGRAAPLPSKSREPTRKSKTPHKSVRSLS